MKDLKEFNSGDNDNLTVTVIEWQPDECRIVLWVPGYQYGLSHDFLKKVPKRQALLIARRLQKLLKADFYRKDIVAALPISGAEINDLPPG